MTTKFDELVAKLKEIFQIDKPELDFGIYKIVNAACTQYCGEGDCAKLNTQTTSPQRKQSSKSSSAANASGAIGYSSLAGVSASASARS